MNLMKIDIYIYFYVLGMTMYVSEQDDNPKQFRCSLCNKSYKQRTGLYNHQKYECGKEPQFQCPHCPYKAKLKGRVKSHIALRHLKIN